MRSEMDGSCGGDGEARRASSQPGDERARGAGTEDRAPSPVRRVAHCCLLVAALGACRGVAVLPDDASWTVTGEDEAAEATWRTGPVRVTIPLTLTADATLLTGSIQNAGSGVVLVTFEPSADVERRGRFGTLSGERPEAGGRWTSVLVPWREIEVPAGTPLSPGTVDFALPPDQPWSADDVPAVGATITWVVHFAGEAGEASCPVLFHVSEASNSWVDDPRLAVVVTLLGLAGLITWGAYM